MCGDDDHLAWKHSCLFRGVHEVAYHGMDWLFILNLDLPSWVRVKGRLIRTPMRSDMDYIPVASLPAKFKMPDIEKYTGIGCPHIHLQLYSTVMRAHGLDESQMITMFLLSLSGQRLYVGTITSTSQRFPKCHQPFLICKTYPYSPHQPCYVAQVIEKPPTLYPRPRAPQTSAPFALKTLRQFSQLAHTSHAIPPLVGGVHFMDFTKLVDRIYMLSWDDSKPKPIVVDENYEVDGVISNPQAFAPFRLVPDTSPVQLTTIGSLIRPCYNIQYSFILRIDPYVDNESYALSFLDDLPPRGFDHTLPLYIFVGCSEHRAPSVLLDNDSALNVCLLATTIALGFGPSNFEPSSQIVRAYDSTRREVLGTLTLDLVIPSSLHQKVKFIHEGEVITIQSTGDTYSTSEPVLEINHGNDDLFLTGFTFDEIQTMEVEHFYRDYVALLFDEHGSIMVLDMMRSIFLLPDTWRFYAMRDSSLLHMPFDYLVHSYRMSLADYFLSDEAPSTSTFVLVTLPSLGHTSLLTLYFPDETDDNEMFMVDMSQITNDVQSETTSPLDLFGVLAIEMVKDVQFVPAPRFLTDVLHDDDVFEGVISPIVYSSISRDNDFSLYALSLPTSHVYDVDDESMQHDSNEDSSVASDSSPTYERVSPTIGDAEIVDFGTSNQPRELRIGLDLSIDERASLIQLLRSYLDVFAWSYENMLRLDPSIVQHHLPLLPHAKPVKQKLRWFHPRWSL
ncbi:hypothetical protein AAG906_016171 [Vitis piasezkii]